MPPRRPTLGADVVFPTSSSEIVGLGTRPDDFGCPCWRGPRRASRPRPTRPRRSGWPTRHGCPPPPHDRGGATRTRSPPPCASWAIPDRRVVMKPTQAKGSRGFRILDPDRRPAPLAARVAAGEAAPERLEDVLELLGAGHVPGLHRPGVPGRARGDRRRDLPRRRAAPADDAHPRGAAGRPGDGLHAARARRARRQYSARLAEVLADGLLPLGAVQGRQADGDQPARLDDRLHAARSTRRRSPSASRSGTTDPEELRRLRPQVPIGRRAIRYFDQVEFGATGQAAGRSEGRR